MNGVSQSYLLTRSFKFAMYIHILYNVCTLFRESKETKNFLNKGTVNVILSDAHARMVMSDSQ